MSEVITIEQIQESNAYDNVLEFFSKGDTHKSLDYFITAHLSKSKQEVAEHHIKHFRNVLFTSSIFPTFYPSNPSL